MLEWLEVRLDVGCDKRGYAATGSEQMCIGFAVWPWSLSVKCFRHTIVRLRYKSIFYEIV